MDDRMEYLQPQAVFRYFGEISKIPRGTGNEKAISDYLAAFAKSHGLEVIQDEVLNVIIRKSATPGYEAAPTIILQGHMDMVCEKNHDTVHDFTKDPIALRIEDDMIYAADTTLGADNGIAVAYVLAILAAKDIEHPAIEALITAGEEGAMTGAFNLDPSLLSGKMLVNIDAEKEGRILVSSAGGVSAKLVIAVDTTTVEPGWEPYRISIGGLRGGHSGADIHKGRGNANKLMGRLLRDLCSEMDYRLKAMNGGLKANAITREAEAEIFIDPKSADRLREKVDEWDRIFKKELSASDAGVSVKLQKAAGLETNVLAHNIKDKLITALILTPNGVQSMSMQISNLVESSTNLGVVQTTDDKMLLSNEIRSSVKTMKKHILTQFQCLSELLNCQLVVGSDYPEWEYKPDSALRELFQRVHSDKYGKEVEVRAIHAGLECGILADKLKGLDVVAIGPNVYDAHTPNEHLSISSTRNVYEYLLEVLKQVRSM